MKNNYPTLDWPKVIEYNVERMASHGVRRADEMDQVAETLRELGIDPLMASATSARQREMGLIGKEPAVRKTLKEGRAAMLDAISAAAKEPAVNREERMNEDVLNTSIRRFLKTVGVTSQREIEKAVRAAIANGKLKGNEALPAKMTLTVGGIDLTHTIDDNIELE